MDAGISVWTQSKVLESNVTFVVKFIHQSGMTMNQLRQKLLHQVELSNSKVCQFEVFCAGFFASFPALSNSWTMKMWLYFIFHKCLFIRRIILIYDDLITISLTFWVLWYWPEMKKTRMEWCPRTGWGQRLMIRTVVNEFMCWQHAKINTPNK